MYFYSHVAAPVAAILTRQTCWRRTNAVVQHIQLGRHWHRVGGVRALYPRPHSDHVCDALPPALGEYARAPQAEANSSKATASSQWCARWLAFQTLTTLYPGRVKSISTRVVVQGPTTGPFAVRPLVPLASASLHAVGQKGVRVGGLGGLVGRWVGGGQRW